METTQLVCLQRRAAKCNRPGPAIQRGTASLVPRWCARPESSWSRGHLVFVLVCSIPRVWSGPIFLVFFSLVLFYSCFIAPHSSVRSEVVKLVRDRYFISLTTMMCSSPAYLRKKKNMQVMMEGVYR
jgi:hypothetical protein